MTDSQFIQDYQASQIAGSFDPFQTGLASAGVSQLYLTGAGDRSYFDIRSMYYLGFSEFDNQGQIPIIHPVLDYSNVLAHQVLGGEFSYKFNLTSLTRTNAEFDAYQFPRGEWQRLLEPDRRHGGPEQLSAARDTRHLYARRRRKSIGAAPW